jgi:hypothetical protein
MWIFSWSTYVDYAPNFNNSYSYVHLIKYLKILLYFKLYILYIQTLEHDKVFVTTLCHMWCGSVAEQRVTGPKLQGCVACVKPGTKIKVNLAAFIHEWRRILSWFRSRKLDMHGLHGESMVCLSRVRLLGDDGAIDGVEWRCIHEG